MRRVLLCLVLLTTATACASPNLSRGEVPGVVGRAFASAGLRAQDIEVAQAPVDGAWPVDVVESGVSLRLKVDARVGRVTSVDVGRSDGPTHAQLERIARYASNPAADRARTRRRLLTLVVIVVAVGGGLLLARRLRLREEAAQSSDGEPNGGA